MIQLTPQMRILLAVEPTDFRRYAERAVMRSWGPRAPENPPQDVACLGVDPA